MTIQLFIFLFINFFTLESQAAEDSHDPLAISGVVVEKGTRKPLNSVNVYCIQPNGATPLKAITALDGSFSIETETSPQCHWIINLAGYQRYEADDAEFAQNSTREIFLERANYQTYETTVYGQKEKRDDNTKSLTPHEITHIAGSGNDPIKAVQNLPGVARSSFLGSNISIEGSAPADTQYFVDNLDVPIILHFSGIYSIINSGAIDRIDFFPAGFGPEYGRSSSGYVGVWTKKPATDRLHGTGYLDVVNAGVVFEGPLNKNSSFLVGARTTYLGPVFGLISKNNPNFNLTAIPDFSDGIAVYQTKLSEADDLKIVTLGSLDSLGYIRPQPTNQNPNGPTPFSLTTAFLRIMPQLTHHYSDTSISRFSLGIGKDWIYQSVGSNYSNINNVALSGRAEIEFQPTFFWTTYLGIDDKSSINHIEVTTPFSYSQGGISNPVATAAVTHSSIDRMLNDLGLYWRNTFHPPTSPWMFNPGIRADYFSQTGEFLPAPRLGIKYALSSSTNLKTSGGLYTQPPSLVQTDPTIGNSSLKASQTWHLTLGIEKDFRNPSAHGWTLDTNLFYKYYSRVITSSNTLLTTSNGTQATENYNNSGYGRAFGVETLAKYNLENGLMGWISYTLSRSSRAFPPNVESLFQYDQTHILTAVGSMDLGRNFLLSGRLRYVTGSPYTPITGASFDADNDIFIPTGGDSYSLRYSPFFQIDLRLEKKWIYRKWIFTAYLDVMNVTNTQNQESLLYSYNYSQTMILNGIPILPTFGLKGEF